VLTDEGFGHVSGWTCEQLCQYLRETGLEDDLVKKFEEKQVDGNKAYNFAIEEAETMFDGDRASLDRYDKAMMTASRKYGFLPRWSSFNVLEHENLILFLLE